MMHLAPFPPSFFSHWALCSFDAEVLKAQKENLVFSSFLVRRFPAYPSRIAAHAQCLAAPQHCRHHDFDPSDEPHSISEVQISVREG